MSTEKEIAAIVGAVGGAGTTRLSMEMGATLARAGHDVAVLDAAFATQGLAGYVAGRVDPDATAVVADDADLSDAIVTVTEGLSICPAAAPFERVARAKTAVAAERFGDVLGAARDSFDYVLVDTPPVATNPAVAAVTEASRVALVTPPTERGLDAVQASHGRLSDVGTRADVTVANRVPKGRAVESADVTVPESATTAPSTAPAVTTPDATFAPAVARATAATFDLTLDLEFPEESALDRVEEYVPDALS